MVRLGLTQYPVTVNGTAAMTVCTSRLGLAAAIVVPTILTPTAGVLQQEASMQLTTARQPMTATTSALTVTTLKTAVIHVFPTRERAKLVIPNLEIQIGTTAAATPATSRRTGHAAVTVISQAAGHLRLWLQLPTKMKPPVNAVTSARAATTLKTEVRHANPIRVPIRHVPPNPITRNGTLLRRSNVLGQRPTALTRGILLLHAGHRL